MPTSRTSRILLLLAGTFLAVAAGLSGPASAQEETGEPEDITPGLPAPGEDEVGIVHSWAVTPAGAGDGSDDGERANLTYQMTAGTTIEDAVTLYNFSNVPLEFDLFTTDARNNDDGAFAPTRRDEAQTGVGSWLTLASERLPLGPGQSARIPIEITVPADARPGDHAGVVLAANAARGTSPDGRVVTLDRQTGTRVYVRVEGELEPELAVAGLSTDHDPRLNPLNGTAEVSYRIENRGNIRLAGTHQVRVGGPFGLFEQSGEVHDLPELLPGESVEFTETIDGVVATGGAFTTVELDPVRVDGSDEAVDTAEGRSIGLALPYLLVALVVAGAFVWIARARFRRHAGDPAPPPDGSHEAIVPQDQLT